MHRVESCYHSIFLKYHIVNRTDYDIMPFSPPDAVRFVVRLVVREIETVGRSERRPRRRAVSANSQELGQSGWLGGRLSQTIRRVCRSCCCR